MDTKTIYESEMVFGPYPVDSIFYIEKSKLYTDIKKDVKIAEFVLLRKGSSSPTLLIVDAKSSSPNPAEGGVRFEHFLADIVDKFINTLSLTFSSCLRRHRSASSELPESFQKLDLQKVDVQFVLVFKRHDKAWLPPLQDALRKKLRPTVCAWALSRARPVLVLNEALAARHGLVAGGAG